MNYLKLADDLFPDLFSGRKTVTIRALWRDIQLGPLRFEPTSGADYDALVSVRRITYCRAIDITDAQAQADGAANAEEMRVALRRFYPDLPPDCVVTIIEFDPYEGPVPDHLHG